MNTNERGTTTAAKYEGGRSTSHALLMAAVLLAGGLLVGGAEARSASYLVAGQDMSAQAQNVVVSRDGGGTATHVFVNEMPLGLSTSGFPGFFGNLASTTPVGSALRLRVVVPEGEITAFDTVPERPTLAAPTSGPLNVGAPITVRWNSATSPDRFTVAATWSCGAGCGAGKTFEAAGAARALTIPANTLPADTTVKLRVYAYNDGTETFTGLAAPGSRMAIRNGDERGVDLRTTSAPSGRPDLVVTAASIDVASTCRPYAPILYVKAEVKNIGTAASSVPSSDVGMVSALHASGNGWGNGANVPGLAPGESTVVRFPIYYLASDPTFMPGRHRFAVAVNAGGWIEESNTANNAYGVVTVSVPAGLCSAGK
ncbi:CARDB domain-containing protein [Deinococcus yavapaiensis]|uniref:CARDB protein n=1 Tax=Deinococcus yavapaiensis KR-236 TaxID=694435 RepID=A0A318S9N9_9DEIO|nr:CARDB domain-containing protein [Deinococcus yavapaiensis]PYE52927.1 CARDB protein [Deinococcus yavapaiensis KR-236]